jgi:hypothetical protein
MQIYEFGSFYLFLEFFFSFRQNFATKRKIDVNKLRKFKARQKRGLKSKDMLQEISSDLLRKATSVRSFLDEH